MTEMATIIFHRGDFWYPTEYPVSYANWSAEAERNPGTTKISSLDGAVLWPSQPTPTKDTQDKTVRAV